MNTYLLHIFSLRLLNDEINKITAGIDNVIRINYDETNIKGVIEECSYYSLLDDDKVVIVNNFKLNEDSKEIEKYLINPNPKTRLILICDKVDKRNSTYKMISTNGHFIEISELKADDIKSKIRAYCKSNDISIDYNSLNILMDYNLSNYDLVLNEIDKISSLSGSVSTKDIEKYAVKTIGDTNFDLCDAITGKDYKKMKQLFDDFVATKSDVIPFVGLLAVTYRLIYAAKAINKNGEELGKILNPNHPINPYRIKLAKEKGYLYTKEELLNILVSLSDIDFSLKTSSIDPYSLLRIFIINI